uniref:type II secretion system protein GspD n=1 Tax=Brevundimonas sp. TaxID=1871086 RepID=UPI0028AAFBEB
GLLMSFTGPDFRARLNAQAGNNRVNILQRPQLVARSGGQARFQVGTDVPIITSQRASDNQSNNGTDILQSVQYRQTGVILDLQPVVYGDRVDITISQEISEVGDSDNPAIASPPILNRSLTTQIAITDGWTGVLGGLISNNYSKVNTGVPFIKDLPVIGSAFQNNSVKGARTELLILITPHILRGDEDMADYAERYAADMNAAFRTGRGWSYTLTPFNVGYGVRGVGFDLPSPNRPSDRRATESQAINAPSTASAPAQTEPQP